MMADSATNEGVGLPEPTTLEVGDESESSASAEDTNEGTSEGAADEGDGEGESAAPGSEQAKSLFQNLIEKDDAPSEDKEEDLPPDIQAGSRAAETIKNLRARSQRAESEHANLQAVLAQNQRQFQGWANSLQQQNQQLREEMIRLQTQAQFAPKPQAGPKTEAQVYIDQLTADIEQRVMQKYVAPLEQRLQQYDQQLGTFTQQQEQAQRNARVQQDAQLFQNEAANVWRKSVLREVPEDVQVPDVGKYLVLAAQAYNPQLAADPEGAARMIRRTILETADLIQRHAGASVQKALKTGKEATAAVPRGGADGATKEGNPDMDTLLHNGFETPMDWKEAGRPRLKRLQKVA